MELILASASPRRRELLELAGCDFSVRVSAVDEDSCDPRPEIMVRDLSGKKALSVANDICREQVPGDKEDKIVLGSDTVVACGGEILGKPEDEEDARRMLSMLSGATHQVYTGVTLVAIRQGEIFEKTTFTECTDVVMRELSGEEIEAYIRTGEPMDKAGAYGIQGKAAVFVSGIRGDYYNVVGLPLCATITEVRKLERKMNYE